MKSLLLMPLSVVAETMSMVAVLLFSADASVAPLMLITIVWVLVSPAASLTV